MKQFILGAFVFWLAVLACAAQDFNISWSKIGGGGGTSSGGLYALRGTAGQQDATSPMTSASFSLTGGFWGIISVVSTPGLPKLKIQFLGSNSVRVSWPQTGNYTLQQNNNLVTGNWTTTSYSINNTGGISSITITPPPGNLFFRLAMP
jgi:hypothetical protein